jgi:hypothetical protein
MQGLTVLTSAVSEIQRHDRCVTPFILHLGGLPEPVLPVEFDGRGVLGIDLEPRNGTAVPPPVIQHISEAFGTVALPAVPLVYVDLAYLQPVPVLPGGQEADDLPALLDIGVEVPSGHVRADPFRTDPVVEDALRPFPAAVYDRRIRVHPDGMDVRGCLLGILRREDLDVHGPIITYIS